MELKEQVEQLGKDVAKVLEKAEGQQSENQKMSADTKSELTALVGKEHEANEQLVKNFETMQGQLDEIATEQKERKEKSPSKIISLKEALFGLGENEGFKALQNKNSREFNMEIKADMLTSTHYTGAVREPDRVLNSPVFQPERMIRMRDLIPGGSTSSGLISYPQEGVFVDNTGTVAEGAGKPQNEIPIVQKEETVRKIAAYVRISEEALNDVPYMSSYISRRLVDKLKNVEDTQILYGSGTGVNLNGIFTQGTTFSGIVTGQNRFDVLRKAIAEARVNEYSTNAILLNPADAAILDLQASATDGHYLLPPFVSMQNGRMFISGVPIIESTFVAADDFIVGDFSNGAQLFDRMTANVRFFEQDADNVTTNKITVRVEERLALAVYHTKAFIKSTFTAAST